MTNDVGTELILALGYAAFLMAVAALLELMARHVHRRSQRTSTAGFTYKRGLDYWECPDGRALHREETGAGPNVVRYRAEAHNCNTCAFKFRCTDSNSGRVIEHRVNSWLDSGLYRFHRGISLVLFVLAALIVVAELVRSHGLREELTLTFFVICGGTIGLRLVRSLLRQRSSTQGS